MVLRQNDLCLRFGTNKYRVDTELNKYQLFFIYLFSKTQLSHRKLNEKRQHSH